MLNANEQMENENVQGRGGAGDDNGIVKESFNLPITRDLTFAWPILLKRGYGGTRVSKQIFPTNM